MNTHSDQLEEALATVDQCVLPIDDGRVGPRSALSGARALLTEALLTEAQLTQAQLTQAQLTQTQLTQAQLTQTQSTETGL